jgi:hypothetical protein
MPLTQVYDVAEEMYLYRNDSRHLTKHLCVKFCFAMNIKRRKLRCPTGVCSVVQLFASSCGLV